MSRRTREFILPDEFWNRLDETKSVFYFESNELYERKKFASRRIRGLLETDFFTSKQKDIVYLMMYERKSQRDVGGILGIKRTTVEDQVAIVIRKLKRYFTKIGLFDREETLLG